MDLATVVAAVTSSVGVSAATAAWLSRALISHRLEKDLEEFKSDLDRQRAQEKALVEGTIRQQVETTLGDVGAERQYVFEAKKRLYTAIGPLRFQLLLACRDLAGRVQSYGTGRSYEMSLRGYYGRSTLFRILRPLCLSELIERQIAYADFAVDSSAVDLLRFRGAALAAFSGGNLVEGHPNVNWDTQTEHVFFDYLGRCANAIMVRQVDGLERAMRFHEFDVLLRERDSASQVAPFPAILENMSPDTKPLFWLRLVAYGHLCNEFINRAGQGIGFERRSYPVAELLAATHDQLIREKISEYERRCQALPESAL
jgi:hypothetical protein